MPLERLGVRQYQDYRKYLSDFLELNKNSFSRRQFSRQIGWPISLISDIISERRELTISRLFEFSEFAQLNKRDTEHLLGLVLNEWNHLPTQRFSNRHPLRDLKKRP